MSEPIIYVVDDDVALRQVLSAVGPILKTELASYSSAEDFLAAFQPDRPGCLVLDIKMKGMSGLELQARMAEQGAHIPIIMISGHADVRTAVESMSMGALTLLEKPFRLEELLTYLRNALQVAQSNWAALKEQSNQKARLASLTQKEREVLQLIAEGKANKEMATLLGLSVRAVEDRRARLMKKVGAKSALDLARILAGTSEET